MIFQKKISFKLAFILLISFFMQSSYHMPEVADKLTDQIIEAKSDYKIVSSILNQCLVIEAIIDSIAQALASGAHKLNRSAKKRLFNNIIMLRTIIDGGRRSASVHLNEENSYTLALFLQKIIALLEKGIDNNFKGFAVSEKTFNSVAAALPKDLSTTTKKIVTDNEKALLRLTKKSEKIGLNKINIAYRALRKFYKEWHVKDVAEHIAVYYGLLIWWVYVTSDSKISKFCDAIPGLQYFKNYFSNLKKWAGEEQHPITNAIETPVNTVISVDHEKQIVYVAPDYNYAYRTDSKDVDSLLEGKINKDGTIQAPYDIQITPRATINDDNFTPPASRVQETVEGKSPSKSWLTDVQNGAKGIVAFDNKTPLFSVAVGSVFATYIKKDALLVADWAKKIKTRLDDYLFGTTKPNNYDEITIRHERFSDIVGREAVKAELQKVVEYICNPDKFDRAGIKVERGYLLAGEPQTGKTLMAKALAGEISAALEEAGKSQKVRLFEIPTDLLVKNGIAYFMELAKAEAPCILFIDELDLLCLQRDRDTKTLSEFLITMSGNLNNNEKDHVIILAATNKPENIDFALRQHGRFGKMFWFDRPTYIHRIEFFVKECEKRCMDISSFNFDLLAQLTENCSFGTLDIVMKKTLMLAKCENAPVKQEHFEEAIKAEVQKIIPHGYKISDEEESIIATSQSGKALISLLLQPTKTLCNVTILPITQDFQEKHVTQQYQFSGAPKELNQPGVKFGNIFSYHDKDSVNTESQEELEKQCKILLAGNIAQKIRNISTLTFDKNDKQEAFNLAKKIVFEGLDCKELPKTIHQQKLLKAYSLIEQYEKEVEALLIKHQNALILLIDELKKYKTLNATRIKELLHLA